jgi:hypothetical protein
MGNYSCIGFSYWQTLFGVFAGFLVGCGCWAEVTVIAFGLLLNFHLCCALRLEGKSQVGIIPFCVLGRAYGAFELLCHCCTTPYISLS